MTARRTTPAALLLRLRDRSPGLASAVLGGALAAGLGLAALTVLVILLWISSPYPDSGPGGALHIAAATWLLAHGAELIRADTLSGTPAPLGVSPLLLLALPVWLLHRAARDAAEGGAGNAGGDAPLVPGRTAWAGTLAGYLAVGTPAALYCAGGDALRPAWPWTGLCVPLVAGLAAGAGVWTAYGRPSGPLERPLGAVLPRRLRHLVLGPDGRPGVVARAAAAGALVLTGGGALLLTVSLARHGGEARQAFARLTEGWSGWLAVLLLCVTLAPNAAVWAAAYALGPGFLLGTGTRVTPLSSESAPLLPPFPLLAAVPDAGAGTAVNWAAGVLPVTAGLVTGWFVGRGATRSGPPPGPAWAPGRTAAAATLAAALCAAALSLLTALASGPLGTGSLSRFGPVWWQAGAATLTWLTLVAVPTSLTVRAWRRRPGEAAAAHGAQASGPAPYGSPDSVTARSRTTRSGTARDRTPGSGTTPDRSPGPGTAWWRRLGSGTARDRTPGSGTSPDRSPGPGTAWWRRLGSGSAGGRGPGAGAVPDHAPGPGSVQDRVPGHGPAWWRRPGFRTARDRAPGSGTGRGRNPGRGPAPDPGAAPAAPRALEGAGSAEYVLFPGDDLGEPYPHGSREASAWDWEMPFGVRDVRPGEGDG
ncbi:cell division protein PerM [Streptomyces edwardsiae]|uniref:DUF6350 family protein n=1 Tax=Streptomyces edwardsiae TaxID=3075527 RepID=A0ABU2QQ87_9ACTN|nr:DUF6350 family protein [Streptomyces sp. DSM 41635]MDT0406629.1 DUF6350 family protein [Streptomyces sp. DSM 41635]